MGIAGGRGFQRRISGREAVARTMLSMSTKAKPRDLGTERARRIAQELGAELRLVRRGYGLSQALVAQHARTSRSQVSRIELGQAPRVSVLELARLLAVVGLRLSARAYPAGRPVRDRAHLELMRRLRARVAPSASWRFEVPVGPPEDARAWDAVVRFGPAAVAVEAETRPTDVQALLRRLALKRREDATVGAVVLLLSDTAHNRSLLREYGDAIGAELPAPPAEVLRAVREGRPPNRSGVVLL
jgi:transcriptional regulator with XRE-family HTH domain